MKTFAALVIASAVSAVQLQSQNLDASLQMAQVQETGFADLQLDYEALADSGYVEVPQIREIVSSMADDEKLDAHVKDYWTYVDDKYDGHMGH